MIAARPGDLKKRGVAMKNGNTLMDLYEERGPLYEKYADVTAYLSGGSVMQSVDEVIKALGV